MRSKPAADAVTIETVGPHNLASCGIGCIADPSHVGHAPRVAWLRRRFDEGLRVLLCRDGERRSLGMLEYVPGEFAWRPVDARGWLFVHCLWVYPSGQKVRGLGSRLIQACVEEARRQRAIGVAAMVSDGPWMVDQRVFLKNGFVPIAEADRFRLVVHRLKQGPEPRFRDLGGKLDRYRGLHLVYGAQCPMLPRSVRDLSEMAAEHGLKLEVTVLGSAREAQEAPSYYGVFNLVWNGRLLSDHYVSKGRFKNLLQREILKSGSHAGRERRRTGGKPSRASTRARQVRTTPRMFQLMPTKNGTHTPELEL